MTKKHTAKVIRLMPRRRKVIDRVKFIEAHGGRLGAFRSYQVKPPASPSSPDQSAQRDPQQ